MYIKIIPNIKNTEIKWKFRAWLFNHVPALKRDSELRQLWGDRGVMPTLGPLF